MRIAVGLLLVGIVGCGPPPPPRDVVSPDALDHQDPKADTSHHPEHRVGGGRSWWRGLWPHDVPDAFPTSSSPPHYYTGCGGCSTDGPEGGAFGALLVLAALTRRVRSR